MTADKKAQSKAKKALSPIARIILDAYEVETKGHAKYLSAHMQTCELYHAMYYAMLLATPKNPNEPIVDYIHALSEVKDYLELY